MSEAGTPLSCLALLHTLLMRTIVTTKSLIEIAFLHVSPNTNWQTPSTTLFLNEHVNNFSAMPCSEQMHDSVSWPFDEWDNHKSYASSDDLYLEQLRLIARQLWQARQAN